MHIVLLELLARMRTTKPALNLGHGVVMASISNWLNGYFSILFKVHSALCNVLQITLTGTRKWITWHSLSQLYQCMIGKMLILNRLLHILAAQSDVMTINPFCVTENLCGEFSSHEITSPQCITSTFEWHNQTANGGQCTLPKELRWVQLFHYSPLWYHPILSVSDYSYLKIIHLDKTWFNK